MKNLLTYLILLIVAFTVAGCGEEKSIDYFLNNQWSQDLIQKPHKGNWCTKTWIFNSSQTNRKLIINKDCDDDNFDDISEFDIKAFNDTLRLHYIHMDTVRISSAILISIDDERAMFYNPEKDHNLTFNIVN